MPQAHISLKCYLNNLLYTVGLGKFHKDQHRVLCRFFVKKLF